VCIEIIDFNSSQLRSPEQGHSGGRGVHAKGRDRQLKTPEVARSSAVRELSLSGSGIFDGMS